MLHLPPKSRSMCTKCCACHAKAARAQRRPRARRRIPESHSIKPAAQKEVHVRKVLPLPRKSSRSPAASKRAPSIRRESKCCACHAKVCPCAHSDAHATRRQPEPSGVQACAGTAQRVTMLNLPRKRRSMCAKCCASHAKAAGAQRQKHPSAADATHK